MSSQKIGVRYRPAAFVEVELDMPRERAVLLFHDINRVLSLLDVALANDDDGLVEDMDPGDQAAYDRLNEVAALLQRELGIEPGEPTN